MKMRKKNGFCEMNGSHSALDLQNVDYGNIIV